MLDDMDEEDASNYEDEFEEEATEPIQEPTFRESVSASEISQRFDELRLILQIKGVKRGDVL